MNNNIKFTIEFEHNKSLPILDMIIMLTKTNRSGDRSHATISNDACFPLTHKISTYTYFV